MDPLVLRASCSCLVWTVHEDPRAQPDREERIVLVSDLLVHLVSRGRRERLILVIVYLISIVLATVTAKKRYRVQAALRTVTTYSIPLA